jgi:hypothetical protein
VYISLSLSHKVTTAGFSFKYSADKNNENRVETYSVGTIRNLDLAEVCSFCCSNGDTHVALLGVIFFFFSSFLINLGELIGGNQAAILKKKTTELLGYCFSR